MEKYVKIILRAFGRVYPSGFYLYYIIAAILFLVLRRNKNIKEKLVGFYSLIAIAAIAMPWFCMLFWKFLRNGGVYWRLLWLVPYAVLISYAAVELIFKSQKKSIRIGVGVILMAAVIFGGSNLYTGGTYIKADNREKLPQITLTAMSVINENAASTGNPYKRLAAPVDILCQIRQTDATILQYGSREMEPQSRNEHKYEGYYYKLMDGYIKDYKNWIARILRAFELNYIIFPKSYELSDHVAAAKGEKIYDDGQWEIWYFPYIKNKSHAGEYVWLEE